MSDKPMPFTCRDPHHNGASEWGWDGQYLWCRQTGWGKWTLVKRVHATPKRMAVLAELMANKPWEHWAKDLI